jgi:peptidyl-prolyl cis-trans isomerase D
MFDVFRSRDKAVRAFLIFLLGLIALSMLVYLIPSSGTGGPTTGNDAVVAQIGSDKVTATEINQTIREMTQSRQLPAALLSIYAPQVIQQAINERALAWKAGQMGMKVSSDEAENAIIDSIPAQYVKDGKVDPAVLNSVLQQNNMTLADMRTAKIREMLVARLEELVSGGVVVTSQEVEKEYHQRNDKVKIQYAVLSDADFRKDSEPTEAEIQSWYDSNKQSFQVPDKRSLAVIVLDPAKIGAGIQITDAQLRSAYNNQQADFTTPERVQARHILLKSDASNDAAVKAKAEALLKQLQGGADFGKMAKEKSEDPGSAAQNGELGWVEKGRMVPEFEKATFALKRGEMSGLVKTVYGYHIIQVEAHEQAHVKPFDEVKAQLTADLQKQAAANAMQNLSDKAVAGLRQDPAHPEKTADAVGGTLVQVPDIEASEPIPGIGVSRELFDAVAALKKGEVTLGPVVLQDGRALIAVVTNLTPAHLGTLDEVKTEVKDKAQQAKLQKIVAAKAAELVSKTQSMGGDLEKAAKSMAITVKTSVDVSRQDPIESVGTASIIPNLFTKPVGTILGPDSVPTGQLVTKIIAITPADAAGLVQQRSKIQDDLKQQKIRDRVTFFQQGLRESLTASGKLKINQEVIDQILASYRQRS